MGLGISTSLGKLQFPHSTHSTYSALNAGIYADPRSAVNFGGMGVHIWEIPKHERHDVITFSLKVSRPLVHGTPALSLRLSQMTIVMPFFLICASFYAKMSITHLYIVLFKHTWLTKVCKVQFVLLTLCWLGGVIPCFVGCRPLAYTWNRTIPGGECFDLKDFWFGTSITALFFDLTCVVLPLPVVWRLKLSTAKKVRLTLVFGLGFLCVPPSHSLCPHSCVFLLKFLYFPSSIFPDFKSSSQITNLLLQNLRPLRRTYL